MRAILIATGWRQELQLLLEKRPSALLKVVDKPIIFHVLEYLMHLGIKEVDILLHHFPKEIKDDLGNGSRWGMTFCYHTVKDANYPFATLVPVIEGWPEQTVIMGCADVLPKFDKASMPKKNIKMPHLVLYPSKQWSGWGFFPTKILSRIDRNTTFDTFDSVFENNFKKVMGQKYLMVDSLLSYKKSNEKAVKEVFQGLNFPTSSKNIHPGIWISRGVSMDETVSLLPPVFIGENCFIHEGVKLGPNVVIGSDSIIDKNSEIKGSIILRRSYIGEALNISDSIVDKNLLINTRLESSLRINEDFILSELSSTLVQKTLQKYIEQFFALSIFTLILPIFLMMLPIFGLHRKKTIALPLKQKHQKTFEVLSFGCDALPFKSIPNLLNIIKGDMHFVGVSSRTIDEVEMLPEDLKNAYLNSKIGAINLVEIEQHEGMSEDEKHLCELFYTVNESFKFDMYLIGRWFSRGFRSLLNKK